MRTTFIALALLCSSAALVLGQGTPGPDANAKALDKVLADWEKAMTSLQSLSMNCERITKDKVFQTTDKFKGTAKFLKAAKPNQGSRASLELKKEVNGKLDETRFEKYICTGTFLYEFDPANKVIRVHDMPAPKQGQVADDSLLTFLFGMKAAQAKQRYDLVYVPASDKWYHYIKVLPKQASDKADFQEARLALLQTNSLPAQVWFLHANGNEVTWNFKTDPKAEPRASDFEAPALPKDWKVQRMQDQKPKIRGAS